MGGGEGGGGEVVEGGGQDAEVQEVSVAQEPPPAAATKPAAPKSAAAAAAAARKINIRSGVTMTVDEMVQNCLYYFLALQHKKLPVKRADLLKHAMNGQKKNFNEVMAKFETVLRETFGMKIIGLEQGKSGFMNYLMVSEYTGDVSEAVTTRTPESEARRTTLFLMLTTMFMQNRSLEEGLIF